MENFRKSPLAEMKKLILPEVLTPAQQVVITTRLVVGWSHPSVARIALVLCINGLVTNLTGIQARLLLLGWTYREVKAIYTSKEVQPT
jgi:hypothetical protein